ncbi:MAG: hypothetical protein HYY06_20265 [Deltaproteobacteria bacterium]|nr:hypothetical protein [Deltaproteobacteria bacterium]
MTKEVFVIVEIAQNKKLWIRIGSAWENRDGSIKVILHAYPGNGEVLIRDPRPIGAALPMTAASAA